MRPTSLLSPSSLECRALFLALVLWGMPAVALAAETVDVLAVTASSTDGMLMDAVDGDPTTAWQNKREGEKDAWLAVRFAQSAKLKGVRLQLDPLGPEVVYDVEASVDGESYQVVVKNQRATSERPADLKFPKPVNALYLRVRFRYTGSKVAPRFRIRELEPLS